MVDVPTEAELQAADAHEAGRAEASAEHHADDAADAAREAEAHVEEAAQVVEDAADDITERVVVAVGNIIGPVVAGLTERMDRLEAAQVVQAEVVNEVAEDVQEVVEAEPEPDEVEAVIVEDTQQDDTGLVVVGVEDESPRDEPAQVRRKKYRRL